MYLSTRKLLNTLYNVAKRIKALWDGLVSIASTSAVRTIDAGIDVILGVFVTGELRCIDDSCLISIYLIVKFLYYLVP